MIIQKNFLDVLQNDGNKGILEKIVSETVGIKFKEIIFEKIEKFQGIAEYDFYLINLIGITKEGKKQAMFIKNIKQGKIKESLFCICDLT